jgi:hypothetical protein
MLSRSSSPRCHDKCSLRLHGDDIGRSRGSCGQGWWLMIVGTRLGVSIYVVAMCRRFLPDPFGASISDRAVGRCVCGTTIGGSILSVLHGVVGNTSTDRGLAKTPRQGFGGNTPTDVGSLAQTTSRDRRMHLHHSTPIARGPRMNYISGRHTMPVSWDERCTHAHVIHMHMQTDSQTHI